MFENCKEYNRPDSRLYKEAAKLQKAMNVKMAELTGETVVGAAGGTGGETGVNVVSSSGGGAGADGSGGLSLFLFCYFFQVFLPLLILHFSVLVCSRLLSLESLVIFKKILNKVERTFFVGLWVSIAYRSGSTVDICFHLAEMVAFCLLFKIRHHFIIVYLNVEFGFAKEREIPERANKK